MDNVNKKICFITASMFLCMTGSVYAKRVYVKKDNSEVSLPTPETVEGKKAEVAPATPIGPAPAAPTELPTEPITPAPIVPASPEDADNDISEVDTWEEDFSQKLDKILKKHKKNIKKIEKKIKSETPQKVQNDNVSEDNETTDWVKQVQKQHNDYKINSLKNTINDDEKQLKKWKRESRSLQRKIKKELNRQKKFSTTLNGMAKPDLGDGNWFYFYEVKSSLDQSRAECVRLEKELEDNLENQQSTMEKLEDDKKELTELKG
ncbi:MAG: hypothetical protein LBU51_01865 [Bacteroidales bacterium]|jgi:hypothetical protein|nr:hypothetical protein [Bacteroidales bacterium]